MAGAPHRVGVLTVHSVAEGTAQVAQTKRFDQCLALLAAIRPPKCTVQPRAHLPAATATNHLVPTVRERMAYVTVAVARTCGIIVHSGIQQPQGLGEAIEGVPATSGGRRAAGALHARNAIGVLHDERSKIGCFWATAGSHVLRIGDSRGHRQGECRWPRRAGFHRASCLEQKGMKSPA